MENIAQVSYEFPYYNVCCTFFIFVPLSFLYFNHIFILQQMIKERVEWSPQQDAVISMLYEQRQIQDWSQIARLANEQYNFPKKNSKLYKERYMNQINPSVFKIEWSNQQQLLFMKLHNQIGNKWASIAQHLIGKTDNCVKNHFYSKLRKLLRKLNKIIQYYLKKQFRPIDISIMYKIVQAAQQRFKQKPNCQQTVSMQCLNVQNKMLQFAMFKDTKEGQQQDQIQYTTNNIQQYKELIQQIYRVSKLYKKKSKKVRNSLIQAPVNHSRKNNKKDNIKNQSQSHSSSQSQKQYKPKQKIPTTILIKKHVSQKIQKDQPISKIQQLNYQHPNQDLNNLNQNIHKKNTPQTSNGRIQVEQGQGIQQLLRTAGILHDQIKPNNSSKNQRHSRKYSSSQYSIASGISNMNQSQQQGFLGTGSNADYSPLHSFTSQQMQNFLGFPMINNNGGNNFANFTLSEKSSFKSYSERDPSQIDNPFFDQYSSNNGRLMCPMNFSLPTTNQYQSTYNQGQNNGYNGYGYNNVYYQEPQQEEQGQNLNDKRNGM